MTDELATKLTGVLATAPGPKSEPPLVAGVANGSTFIKQGMKSGIKGGDRFQVVRLVNVRLKDPTTQEDIKQKQKICIFVVVNADEKSSSGTCEGGKPQSGDVAAPIQ